MVPLRSALFLAVLAAPQALAADQKRPSDAARGEELYERHCLACHGVRAAGDGPATTALVAEVPDLQGKVKADKATIDIVIGGRGPMPAFEPSFDASDAKRILRHMAKLTNETPKDEPKDEPEPDPKDAPEEAGDGQQPD